MIDEATTLLAKTSFERWTITITVMLVAIVEVLDVTIVTVALPPMMGSLGATSDQITWVLTSYIVSSAIFMVLTGFLVNRLGRKTLLLSNILGFLIASMLCGIATSLPEMVLFRTLQGIFGASLVPLSQLILRSTFPYEQMGKAMAIWGIGIMVAPILGPTLGGYITQNLTWRWVFYLNVPICIVAFVMTLRFIKETPRRQTPIDWLGMILMAVGVGSLQIFLDRGNSESWFQSHFIIAMFLTCLITLTLFFYRSLHNKNSIINVRLYKDQNFSAACFILMIYCACMLGLLSLQPLLLENIIGYTTQMTGIIMAPRGIASAAGMVICSLLMKRYDSRKIIFFGILLSSIGTYIMAGFNITTEPKYWMYTAAIQGFGMGLFFVPISTTCFDTLSEQQIPEAAGLFSFARNIGISVGISIFSTLITRESQLNWNRLGGHIQIFNPNLHQWLLEKHWNLSDPIAIHTLMNQVSLQSSMIAFLDCFWFMTFCLVATLPLVFIIKRSTTAPKPMGH